MWPTRRCFCTRTKRRSSPRWRLPWMAARARVSADPKAWLQRGDAFELGQALRAGQGNELFDIRSFCAGACRGGIEFTAQSGWPDGTGHHVAALYVVTHGPGRKGGDTAPAGDQLQDGHGQFGGAPPWIDTRRRQAVLHYVEHLVGNG